MNTRFKWLSLLLATALLAVAQAAYSAEPKPTVDPDAKCLKCHSKKLKKQLGDGETMFLQINGEEFGQSVHSVIGCTGCHRDVAKSKHPSKTPVASRREYSLKHNQTCSQCHAAKQAEYQDSVHARMVAGGNVNAPVCSDCHSSHSVSRAVYEPVSAKPRPATGGNLPAYARRTLGPGSNDPRGAVGADLLGLPLSHGRLRSPPAATAHTCWMHDGATGAREQGANAGMHLGAVASACHLPIAGGGSTCSCMTTEQAPVSQQRNGRAVRTKLNEIDPAGDGLDPVELWKLVRQGSRDGKPVDVTLRGRLEVTTGVDAHRTAPSTEAVRSCESCHQRGAEAFENVTVSISRPDGRKERFEADQKVLNSVVSVESVGDFYAPGGTRIRLLDGLLLLALVGGLAVPIGHMALGRIIRRKKGKQ
jgi:hypothetical protein